MLNDLKVAILASGQGTNALALKKQYEDIYNSSPVLITDNPGSPIAKIGLHLPYTSKEKFEASLLTILVENKIDWLFLAGYMRILSPICIDTFARWHAGKNQILNIHPSLLPKYKGKDGYKQAWNSSDTHTGVSIHFVTPELDSGEILVQIPFAIDRDKTLTEFIDSSKKIENDLYRQVFIRIAQGEIPTIKFKESDNVS